MCVNFYNYLAYIWSKITINNYELEVVEQFIYLGSILTSKFSLEIELDRRIGMAASAFTRLGTRVWRNPRLSIKTKVTVYNACVVSTLLYGSECWTTYAAQEHRLNVFHMRSLRKLLGISWMSRTPNTIVLPRCGPLIMFTIFRQHRNMSDEWKMKESPRYSLWRAYC